MILNVIIDDQIYELNVPDALIAQADDFFTQMDRDLDQGVQMSMEWVDRPNQVQRCQYVANKLHSAVVNNNDRLGRLMAGYICARMPDIDTVEMDETGEMQTINFRFKEGAAPPAPPASGGISASAPGMPAIDMAHMFAPPPGDMDSDAAMRKAEEEISQVFKIGRQYRFSMLNRITGEWVDAATVGSEEEAQALRQQAVRSRYYELSGEQS